MFKADSATVQLENLKELADEAQGILSTKFVDLNRDLKSEIQKEKEIYMKFLDK